MIKRGDKVVCIKSFITIYEVGKIIYEVGKIYEVDDVNRDFNFINYVYIAEENNFGRYGFSLTNRNTLVFSEYFILLSEYRENQIKTVLDD